MTTITGGIIDIQGGGNTRPIQNIAEQAPTEEEAARRNNDALSRAIRVCLPAQIVSYNAAKQTATVLPMVPDKNIDRLTGNVQWVQLPQIPDVPVCFPQGGNFVLTMPVTPGDEVMLVFVDTCMDTWHTTGTNQPWNDRRRHDLSDAVAIVGVNSIPHVIPGIATDATELRSVDGAVSVKVKSDSLIVKKGSADITIDSHTLLNGVVPSSYDRITLDQDGSTITVGQEQQNILGVLSAVDAVTITATNINLNGTLFHNGNDFMHHKHTIPTGFSGGVTEVP